MSNILFTIEPLTSADRAWLADFLTEHWGSPWMVTNGRMMDLSQAPGFAARSAGQVVGLATYRTYDGECELTSLDSLQKGAGVGTALLLAVRAAAELEGCRRLWLVTTNDNTRALRFYQRRGFRLCAVRPGQVERISRPLKPAIPLTGLDGIPIRDELELEMTLENPEPSPTTTAEPPPVPDFPTRLDRQVLYTSPWVTLYRDKVLLPNGRLLPDYHVVSLRNAVGVLVENDQGELLFEQVYRYHTGRLEWEIPAGGIEDGEDILAAARREVYEETGCETHDHRLVYTFFPNNGSTGQQFHLVRCRSGAQTGAPDPGEIKDWRWISRSEALGMVQRGDLMDGLSLVGLLLEAQDFPQNGENL
jgi:8-oxo-dGTP pyrophosphatase MutT (NUDIX family)/GNAT superfamily N-acetyltransferase